MRVRPAAAIDDKQSVVSQRQSHFRRRLRRQAFERTDRAHRHDHDILAGAVSQLRRQQWPGRNPTHRLSLAELRNLAMKATLHTAFVDGSRCRSGHDKALLLRRTGQDHVLDQNRRRFVRPCNDARHERTETERCGTENPTVKRQLHRATLHAPATADK